MDSPKSFGSVVRPLFLQPIVHLGEKFIFFFRFFSRDTGITKFCARCHLPNKNTADSKARFIQTCAPFLNFEITARLVFLGFLEGIINNNLFFSPYIALASFLFYHSKAPRIYVTCFTYRKIKARKARA